MSMDADAQGLAAKALAQSGSKATLMPLADAVNPAVRNNYVVGMGDSNMAGQGGWGTGLCNTVCSRSGGLLRLRNNGGISGQTSTQITVRMQKDCLAFRPGIVILMQGTNDVGLQSTILANDAIAIARARAMGCLVVYCPIYPHTSFEAATLAVNAAKKAFWQSLNDPMVLWADFFSLIGNASGGWLNGSFTGDGVHITNTAQRPVSDFVVNLLKPYLAPLQTPRPIPGETYNPVGNGTFDQGSATGGVASGWTLQTPANITPSIVASVTGDNIIGNWQRLTVAPGASSNFSYAISAAALTPWAGKRVVVSCRLRISGVEALNLAGFNAKWSIVVGDGGSASNTVQIGLSNNFPTSDLTNDFMEFEGVFSIEAGANASSFNVFVSNPAGSGANFTFDISEVVVYAFEETGISARQPDPVRTLTAFSTYTVTAADAIIEFSANGASPTFTLPSATTVRGQRFTFKRTDATSGRFATINTTSSQTIDGATSFTGFASQNEYVVLQSDGVNWMVVERSASFLAQTFTANAQITPSLPAGCRIDAIDLIETAGQSAGNISIGTASAGTDVVNAVAVGASAIVTVSDAAILKRLFSTSATQALFVSSSAWGTSSVNARIRYTKNP